MASIALSCTVYGVPVTNVPGVPVTAPWPYSIGTDQYAATINENPPPQWLVDYEGNVSSPIYEEIGTNACGALFYTYTEVAGFIWPTPTSSPEYLPAIQNKPLLVTGLFATYKFWDDETHRTSSQPAVEFNYPGFIVPRLIGAAYIPNSPGVTVGATGAIYIVVAKITPLLSLNLDLLNPLLLLSLLPLPLRAIQTRTHAAIRRPVKTHVSLSTPP